MANRTDPLAQQVHGCNPQTLVSRIIRRKIYESVFWKEQCFALTAETVLEPCVGLTYVGGTYGGKRQPAPFLCLVLKLLQIQPEPEIILEFIKQEQFKYLRAVGAFYLRLVGRACEVYTHLEPLLADYRKLRLRLADGKFTIVCMDEFVDDCLRKTNFLDVDLPVLPKREVLENEGDLPPTRLTALEHDVEVYAPSGVSTAEGVSERDQQLWLLQKEQLRKEQKQLQRRVLQQRMKQKQQEQEQLLLQQVRELEAENGVADRPENTRKEDSGEGWWREKREPGDRERERERDRERERERERDRDHGGDRRPRRREEREEGEKKRETWHSGRSHGGREGGYETRERRGRVGSRSLTPVVKREKERRDDDEDERRRRRREEEERERRRERRRWEDEERERRRRDRREEREEEGDRKRRRHEDEERKLRDRPDDRYSSRSKHAKERGDEDRRSRRDAEQPSGDRAEKKAPAFSLEKSDSRDKKGDDDALSVQAWDALRAQLGLKPLKK
ncbi:UNVERIFIED_CONTAM: pre-mRNA splicing factor, putative [Hammondia hammondi]|eukprot:XP_008888258.1 pre-mRNA splicing factor, putative [Hammondia hammondi]